MAIGQISAANEDDNSFTPVGGKKRKPRKSRKGVKSRRKVHHKKTKKRGHKKGPSKWIMHVKAYCKKTGKTFPEALKDPMCRKTFKH